MTIDLTRRSTRAGVWISDLSSPVVLNPLTCLAIAASAGGPLWGILLGLASGGIPAALIAHGMNRGAISDKHVSVRRERPVVMLGTLGSLVLAVVAAVSLRASDEIIKTGIAYLTLLTGLTLITLAMKWKISAHAAVVAANGLMIGLVFGGLAWLVLALVPIVMWARVRVQQHTRVQVLAGAAVGLSVCLLVWLPA